MEGFEKFAAILGLILSVISISTLIFKLGAWSGEDKEKKRAQEELKEKVDSNRKDIEGKLQSSIKAVEEKQTLLINNEVKRNDEMTLLIRSNTQSLAKDQKESERRLSVVETKVGIHDNLIPLVQDILVKVTEVRTICENCIGRSVNAEDHKEAR